MMERALSTGSGGAGVQIGLSMGRWRLETGALLSDRYRVVARIGAGGMGEVYEVEHVVLGRHFAAKVLRRELVSEIPLVSRFASEVKAMARLRSDHVAQIVDTGRLADGTPYFVMEQLFGEDLKAILQRNGSLPPHRAVRLVIDACWGLQAVHGAGLVHRDIKPSNLFIAKTDSGDERCILLDFGVTKSCDTAHTRKGQLVGTLQYMAPEQLDGGKLDSRTDLYAVGAVLYECLAGFPPHKGETLEQMLYGIMNKEAVPLWKVRPEISEGLSELVGRAISRNPTDRFEEASAMVLALQPYTKRQACRGEVIESSALSTAPDRLDGLGHSWIRRTRRLALWGGLGVLIGCFSILVAAALQTPTLTLTPTVPGGTPHSGEGRRIAPALEASPPDAQLPRSVSPSSTGGEVSSATDVATTEAPTSLTKSVAEPPVQQRGTSRARKKGQQSIIDAANPYDK